MRLAFLLASCAWLGCASVPPRAPAPRAPLTPESPRSREPEPGTSLDAESLARVVDPESAARARVVAAAESMIGVPYRYGGGSPDGFDCSGLVRYSYERGGFPELPHSSSQQYATTQRIALDELEPGDLLFFTFRGRNVSHVGIYVGGKEFVHAAKTTRRVERVRLDHPYWKRQIQLAGRVRWSAQ
jgi:cell wall-associated NlpC family hydrolase